MTKYFFLIYSCLWYYKVSMISVSCSNCWSNADCSRFWRKAYFCREWERSFVFWDTFDLLVLRALKMRGNLISADWITDQMQIAGNCGQMWHFQFSNAINAFPWPLFLHLKQFEKTKPSVPQRHITPHNTDSDLFHNLSSCFKSSMTGFRQE